MTYNLNSNKVSNKYVILSERETSNPSLKPVKCLCKKYMMHYWVLFKVNNVTYLTQTR